MYGSFWNQLWLSFLLVNKEIKVFPGKVTLKERSISYSKMNTLFFCVFVLFVLTCEMYSLSKMKSTSVWEKMNSLWFVQDKHYELSVAFDKENVRCLVLVVYFSFWPWYVLLFFDGKNDRCRIVVPFWDTFNIDIDCWITICRCSNNFDMLLFLSFAWYG